MGRDERRPRLRAALVVVFWLLAWQLVATAVGTPLLLAGPLEAASALCRAAVVPGFWTTIGFTSMRIAGGLAFSFAAGLALAGLASRFSFVRELARPPLLLCKSVPVVCVAVLMLLWVDVAGISLVCVALVVLPAVYFSALEGLSRLDARREELLDVFGLRGGGRGIRRVLVSTWPQMLPYVLGSARSVVGMAWKAGVAAELIGIPADSMGERIYQAKLLLETGDLFAWTAVVVACSWICERIALLLLKASGPAAQRLGLLGAFSPQPAAGEGRVPSPVSAASADCGWRADLRVEDVLISYGGAPVVQGLSLDVLAGTRVCLYAPSGTGKTTVLRMLAGLIGPRSGRVVGRPSSLACVSQSTCLIEELTAVENVAVLSPGHRTRGEVEALLGEVLPASALSCPVAELSGGQRRRVELVRALAHPCEMLLLDEPFSGLDEGAHARAAKAILAHLHGRSLVVATHDAADAYLLDARRVDLPRA